MCMHWRCHVALARGGRLAPRCSRPDRHRGRQQPLPFLRAAEILDQLLDLPVRQVRLQDAEGDVIGQPPTRLHLAAAPDHRRRNRHLMTEHQLLARGHRPPGGRDRHQRRDPAPPGTAQVSGPHRDDPRHHAGSIHATGPGLASAGKVG